MKIAAMFISVGGIQMKIGGFDEGSKAHALACHVKGKYYFINRKAWMKLKGLKLKRAA